MKKEQVEERIKKLRIALDEFLASGECSTFCGDVYVEITERIEALESVLESDKKL